MVKADVIPFDLITIELNGDEIKGDYICFNHMVYWKREAYK